MLRADRKLLDQVRPPRGVQLRRAFASGEDYSERSMTVPYPYESYVDERHQRDYEIVFSRHWALTREYEVPRHVSTKTILLKVAAALPNWQETFDNHSSAPPAPNNEVYLWRQGDCVFAVVYPASALFFDHHHHRTLSLTAAHMNRSSCS